MDLPGTLASRPRPAARIASALLRQSSIISTSLYCAAILGLLLLPLTGKGIYHDENALLVGHSEPVIRKGDAVRTGQQFASRLMQQLQTADGSGGSSNGSGSSSTTGAQRTATEAARAFMQQSNIEVYEQTFPSRGSSGRVCNNLHGVLRAPRGDGKEGLVVVTPLALPDSNATWPGWQQSEQGAALALGLAGTLAAHLGSVPWLAKDLVWVVPDARCGLLPSMEAWLAEYQDGARCGSAEGAEPSLRGRRFGRAGQLQQAIVLHFGSSGELPNDRWKVLRAPLVGAAGQLPKLDLFYLFRKYLTYHAGDLSIDTKLPPSVQGHAGELWTAAVFAAQQAAGLPTAPHAAFKPYGIDAITVAIPPMMVDPQAAEEVAPSVLIDRLAPVLELTFRSLNGLLERFHHSYFLYVLLSPDRFLKVETYLVPAVLMLLALVLQAAAAVAGIIQSEQPRSSRNRKQEARPTPGNSLPGSAAADGRQPASDMVDTSGGTPAGASWARALATVAALHAVPAALAFALRTAFAHHPCGSSDSSSGRSQAAAATAAAAAADRAAGSQTAVQLLHRLVVPDSASVAAATAATCVLASMAWRHARAAGSQAAAPGSSGSSDDGAAAAAADPSTTESANLTAVAAAQAAAAQPAAGAGEHPECAVLAAGTGCGGRQRLKAAATAAAASQLSVIACTDWAAATAALLLLVPWLAAAASNGSTHEGPCSTSRPATMSRRPTSTSTRLAAAAAGVLMCASSCIVVPAALAWCFVSGASSGGLAGILHDVTGLSYGGTGSSSAVGELWIGLRAAVALLAASPVLCAVLFGVYLPAWLACMCIASSKL